MLTSVVKLAEELIRFNTAHPNFQDKRDCLNFIKGLLKEDFEVQEFEFQGFPSVLFSTQKNNHYNLLLAGHIDVVSGPEHLFQPVQKDGKLFGRGAYDMKGAVAAIVKALRGLPAVALAKAGGGSKKENIGLLLTSDEEIDGQNGTKAVLDRTNLTADFALLPDNGQNWEIVVAERGLLHVRVPAGDKEKIISALASYFPKRGNENTEWVTTYTSEVSPVGDSSEVESWVDIRLRFVSDADKQKALEIFQQTTFEVIREHTGFTTPENNPHLQKLRKLVQEHTGALPNFAKECRTNESDAIYFGERNIPVALVRPLGGGMHQDGEWLGLAALENFSKILQTFLNE